MTNRNKTLWIVLGSCAVLAGIAGAVMLCGALGLVAWNLPVTRSQSTDSVVVMETVEIETAAPETEEPATSTPVVSMPATPETNASAGGIDLLIDKNVASGVEAQTVLASPPSTDKPWWEVYPQYRALTLQDYVLAKTFHKPVIFIYPAEEYAQMDENAGKIIADLKKLLEERPGSVERLPFLPLWNAGPVMHARLQYLDFQNGSGVRYLTEYAQYTAPINNMDLFYTFQGLTGDGEYYIAAVLPVSHPELPPSADMNAADMEKLAQNYTQYLKDMVALLEARPAASFVPGIDALDGMIESIRVGE